MKTIHLCSLIILILWIAGCAGTSMNIYRAAGTPGLCVGKSNSLGYVGVLPEAAWRADQKEPDKRELMALEEIQKAFQNFPCGSLAAPGGVRNFSNWSSKPEAELLKQFSAKGVDTVILLRMEELTPHIYFTFSLPVLWAGSSEADFRIRMLSVKSGEVLADMRVKRTTGGPFHIRPADWSRNELRAALLEIMGNAGTN